MIHGYHRTRTNTCSWRHQLKPWKQKRWFRSCLLTILVLECSFGITQFAHYRLASIPIIKIEDTVQVEWFVPGTLDSQGKQDIYGLKFDWKKGELRLYHSNQQINDY